MRWTPLPSSCSQIPRRAWRAEPAGDKYRIGRLRSHDPICTSPQLWRFGSTCRSRTAKVESGTATKTSHAPRADLAAAVLAGPVQHDLVLGDPHRDPPAELLDRALEVRVGERGHGAAVV